MEDSDLARVFFLEFCLFVFFKDAFFYDGISVLDRFKFFFNIFFGIKVVVVCMLEEICYLEFFGAFEFLF